MKLLRSFVIAAAVGSAVAASAGTASAFGIPLFNNNSCSSCGNGHAHAGRPVAPPTTLFQGGFGYHKAKLPAFQAAPWYNYWPYDAHFLTPAPISGPFYGPPLTGNFPVNPYFPGPAGAVGFGAPGYGFGQGLPGGAPPYPAAMPAPGAPGARAVPAPMPRQ